VVPLASPRSKFTPDNCQAIVELLFDGVSIPDAARETGINVKTVKNWLSKGRAERVGQLNVKRCAFNLDLVLDTAEARARSITAVDLATESPVAVIPER
jgi:hypothetical protein